ncbi:MAG TPA: hypothetical protein O0X48_04795, partial [Methanocorpusculum sp.]|nr:hypothetical protein [Methanocorpusculum sp.]
SSASCRPHLVQNFIAYILSEFLENAMHPFYTTAAQNTRKSSVFSLSVPLASPVPIAAETKKSEEYAFGISSIS